MATGSTTGKDADAKYEELQKQLETLRGDVTKLTDTLQKLALDEYDGARSRAKGVVAQAKRRGEEMRDDAYARAELGIEEAAEYVREKPLTAVAGAAFIGLIFGYLSAPRR